MMLPYRHIHIIGAGGAGMSALAKVLSARGHLITGTDLRGGEGLQRLGDLGIGIFIGHHPEVAKTADLVVASSAVPEYDEELATARDLGIPTWRRPDLLDALTKETPTLGATGTHGKTTTTALLLTALQKTGLDPSFVIGGNVAHLGTNGHHGSTDLLVLEADEAFKTFERLHLEGLVVTNVEPDHLDHFGTEADLLDSFTSVASAVTGPVLACIDDPGSAELARRTGALTYGAGDSAVWRMTDFKTAGSGSEFRVVGRDREVTVVLNQPGVHVALNACGALGLLSELGHDLSVAASGLESFTGVGRRWEHRGRINGITLVDDYAHHPTEVAATLSAARSVVDGRLLAVFQPHLYSRTERFGAEFGKALGIADVIVVTDIYGAREAPVPGITGKLVADAARGTSSEVHYVAHRADLAEFLLPRLRSGDFVLTMGAGDITLLHTELAAALASRS